METTFKTLAEPKRVEILRLVWTDELAATEIACHFTDVTRPAISQHLAVLRRSGLLSERRDGTRRLYRANHAEMAKLRAMLDSFWADSLERLREVAEASERLRGER